MWLDDRLRYVRPPSDSRLEMASIRLQCRLSERSAVMRGKSESSVRLTIPASYSESSEIWSCGPEAADAMVARPVACNSLTFRAKGPCELTVNKVASFSFSPPPVLFITSTCAEPRYRPRLQRWQNPPSIRHEARNFPRNPDRPRAKKNRGAPRPGPRTHQIWYLPNGAAEVLVK